MFEEIPYKKPLIIGTGGGNDIVSATLILADLMRHGRKADLAGICSPGAWHKYDGKEEQSVNLVTKNTIRYRASRFIKYISFIDSRVPGLLQKEGIDVKVFNLSLRYGTSKLIEGLQNLIEREGYDGIIAVDVGGDILARGKEDSTILSPLMDFSTLYVLSKLEIPTTLIEFGFQTDGELRPKGCEEILKELKDTGILKKILEINLKDPAVNIYKNVYHGIENIRHGHTAAMTFRTLEEKENINTIYRARVQIDERKWYHEFPLVLESKYFAKAFLIDNKELAKRRILSFPYENPLELYLKTKLIVDTKTEMDMVYSRINIDNADYILWLGLLCPQINDEKRMDILKFGLGRVYPNADLSILWHKDAEFLPSDWYKVYIDGFVLAGISKSLIVGAGEEIHKII